MQVRAMAFRWHSYEARGQIIMKYVSARKGGWRLGMTVSLRVGKVGDDVVDVDVSARAKRREVEVDVVDVAMSTSTLSTSMFDRVWNDSAWDVSARANAMSSSTSTLSTSTFDRVWNDSAWDVSAQANRFRRRR